MWVLASIVVLLLSILAPGYHYYNHVLYPHTRDWPLRRNWDGRISFAPSAAIAPQNLNELRFTLCRVRGECGDALPSPVKVVGSGHSWSDIASMGNGTMVTLDRMSQVIAVDKEAKRIRVEAGIRLKELYKVMDKHGLALHNVASVDEQSIAGALAPSSHGSGLKYPSMSAAVVGLQIVTGAKGLGVYDVHASGGERVKTPTVVGEPALAFDAVGEDPTQEQLAEWFVSARAGIGALGVITQVELQCEDAFLVRSTEFVTPKKPLFEPTSSPPSPTQLDGKGMAEITEQYEFAKIWALPHVDYGVLVHGIRRSLSEPKEVQANTKPGIWSGVGRWKEEIDSYVIETLNRIAFFFPSVTPIVNSLVLQSKSLAGNVERQDRSHALQVIPFRVPYHTEMEMSVPVCNAARLMRATEESMKRQGIYSGFIFELRFVAPDDIPLSPHQKDIEAAWPFSHQHSSNPPLYPPLDPSWDAPSSDVEDLLGECADGSCKTCGQGDKATDVHRLHVTIGLYYPNEERLRRYFGTFERLAMPLGGRPHWAKNFYATPGALKANFPEWDRFLAARRQIDPQGIFAGPFLKRVFGEEEFQ